MPAWRWRAGCRAFGAAPRVLVVFGVLLAAVAIVGDWTGFGWLSGPAAIGSLCSWLLALMAANLPAATDPPLASGDGSGPSAGADGD
jgi:uncharacterized protein involved in response to NO